MAIAVRMGERGLGTTAPNPAVGALVVDPATGEVISRGWTQVGGRPHAEPEALGRAGERAAGATLYVTLEPCSHHGRSPPCVDAIITAGIKRVVCGIEDPDPRVAGSGLARLRAAGIEVVRGVLRAECHRLTLGHILRVTERRPMVQLKMAVGPQGLVPRGSDGKPTWVTGAMARSHGHLLRAQADAILIGHGTLADDDPLLTCRLPGLEHRSPIRVVLAGRSKPIDRGAALIREKGPPVWWMVPRGGPASPLDEFASDGQDIIAVTSVGDRLWLPAVMEELVARGITRLLIEGGPGVWSSFDRASLVDEVVLFRARSNPDVAPTRSEVQSTLRTHVPRTPLRQVGHRHLGSDDMFLFRRDVGSRPSEEM